MPYQAAQYIQSFLAHRKALEELLEKIPDDQGDFTSWEGAMSFKSLTDHLANASIRFSSMAEGKTAPPVKISDSFAEAKANLLSSTEVTSKAIAGLSDEQLSTLIDAFGGKMPVFALIDIMKDHEVHHKGQLWMMARMLGIEPGMFLKRG